VPTADALVLTDDKAPLEKLTDTFLDDQEAGLVDAQTDAGPEVFARRAGFLALRAKQGQLLWAAGLGWSLVLSVAGFLVFRPRTTSRS